ncbi:conserved hypothetical protein [Neospora caninum Liverpool]|uniref:Transmembrane protein n=1 Tax=Neospora caninum (strain Liverpool) TaxID=572307 RepID=F0VFJ8_NEOCL|nr:conserved hypothetical protein [Neospora caninum Liverpool]CBZ52492.1 conserved hypothetical protein [Neospora caninum Liverpool]CEL66469.1 TPA: hypothetical protein BN1204_022810 [Neospora caninum Liverpool]|eukprot:XP_003882524.1 conserved hypothetical protein [Neospora caninum Liverpool]
MAPHLVPFRLGRNLALGVVLSFIVGCCTGPSHVFDAGVFRRPPSHPAGTLCGFLAVTKAASSSDTLTTKVVESPQAEDDEKDDGQDSDPFVPLDLTAKRRGKRTTRTHSRRDNLLQNPVAAATLGLTLMLVGASIGAGAMVTLARQRQKQKKAEDTRTAEAAKLLEPQQVMVAANKAALQKAEGDRYLTQLLFSIGGAFVSSGILRIMASFRVPFIYTSMTDQGMRTIIHHLMIGSTWRRIFRQGLFAMGLSAASHQLGMLAIMVLPIALFLVVHLITLRSQTTGTANPEGLGQTYVLVNNMMRKALAKEKAGRPEEIEKVVTKYFDVLRKEAAQRKILDAGAKKTLDAAEHDIKSQIKKKKNIDAVIDSVQTKFLKSIGVNIQAAKMQ